MAETYYEDVTASDLSLGGSYTHVLAATQPGATSSDSLKCAHGTNISGYYATASGDPASGTSTGTFTVKVNITSTFSSQTGKAQLHRVNSSGTIQASSGYSATQSFSSAGVITFTFTNPALGTWVSGNRLVVEINNANGQSSGSNRGPTFETGGTNDVVSAPWTLSTTYNDSPSGSAAATGSKTESLSFADTESGSASASGSITEAWGFIYSDFPTGSASSTGTNADSVSFADSETGVASSSGSLTDSWSENLSPSGAASATGTDADSLSFADSPSGTETASGSNTESWVSGGSSFSDSPSGSAQGSGSLMDSLALAESPIGLETASGSLSDSLFYAAVLSGSASATGSKDEYSGFTDAVSGSSSASGHITETNFSNVVFSTNEFRGIASLNSLSGGLTVYLLELRDPSAAFDSNNPKY